MDAVSDAVSGPPRKIVNIPGLISDYYTLAPDPDDRAQLVAFGTSGHRGSSSRKSFNEAHILAVAQAVAEHRAEVGVSGPLYIGADTHALSEPALRTCTSASIPWGDRGSAIGGPSPRSTA